MPINCQCEVRSWRFYNRMSSTSRKLSIENLLESTGSKVLPKNLFDCREKSRMVAIFGVFRVAKLFVTDSSRYSIQTQELRELFGGFIGGVHGPLLVIWFCLRMVCFTRFFLLSTPVLSNTIYFSTFMDSTSNSYRLVLNHLLPNTYFQMKLKILLANDYNFEVAILFGSTRSFTCSRRYKIWCIAWDFLWSLQGISFCYIMDCSSVSFY